jgi:H-NS histone family
MGLPQDPRLTVKVGTAQRLQRNCPFITCVAVARAVALVRKVGLVAWLDLRMLGFVAASCIVNPTQLPRGVDANSHHEHDSSERKGEVRQEMLLSRRSSVGVRQCPKTPAIKLKFLWCSAKIDAAVALTPRRMPRKGKAKAQYRDPKNKETWSGRGRMARWLKSKQDAGEEIEKYLI